MSDEFIRHLVSAAEWQAWPATEPFRPTGFEREGFMHCTAEPEILLQVANNVFKDSPGEFLVLVIDPAKVRAEVKFEAPVPAPPASHPLARHLFPHIYGPLNQDAVIGIHPARRAEDGTFLSV